MQKEDVTMAYHQHDKMRRIYMGDFPESWKAEAQVVTTYIKELRQVNYEEMRKELPCFFHMRYKHNGGPEGGRNLQS